MYASVKQSTPEFLNSAQKMAMAKPWNPMEDAFKNKEFNKYQQGPGADLDDDLQPGAVASGGTNRKKFRLCIKNIPKEMTPKAVENLCSNYGKVLEVHNPTTTPYIFICFATLNDMERALTGLKDNAHGIVAELARERTEQSSQNNARPANLNKTRDENYNPSNQNQVDMSRRSIKAPFTNPKRPGPMNKKPLVTHNDYETSKLKIVDPQKHFLIQNDMHENDRSDYKRKSDNFGATGGKQVHTGRSYHTDSKETSDRIKQLSESSRGSYNNETNSYIKESSNPSLNEQTIGNCILCGKTANKVCQRCGDYYCSFECQKKDWSKHRYICFQMPNLVVPSTTNIGVDLPVHAPDLTNASYSNSQTHNQDKRTSTTLQNKIETEKPNSNKQFQNNNTRNQRQPQQKPQQQSQHQPQQQNTRNSNVKPSITDLKKSDEQKAPPPSRKDDTIKKADIPKSGASVALTAISKSNLVYIRSLAPEDNLEYVRGLNIVNNQSKKSKFIDKLPQRGDLLVSDFQETGFYRVLVLNVENDKKITVAYIDFGNVEVKKLSELKELTAEAFGLKSYPVPVRLKGVPDFQPSDKIMDYLNTYLDSTGKDLKIVYEGKHDNITEVELIDIATNENVNKKIVELRDIKVPKDSETPVMNTDIEINLLPEGENVPVYVFDNSLAQTGYISFIHEKDVLSLEAFNQEIKEYAEKTSEPYTPREGEICLVKYEEDGVWYRAECIEVVGDGNPSVLFIDYGNITTSHINNIRKYPKEFTHPCCTSSCLISDLPDDLDEKVANRLKELIPLNEKFILQKVVTVKVEEENINIVHLPKTIQTLKSEKLI